MGKKSLHVCALCGTRFLWDPDQKPTACKSCPLARNCGMVVCPNCGYEFPTRSRIAEWLTMLWKKWRMRNS